MGGYQSTPKITRQDRAILDIKLQRDKLKQYQRKVQSVLNREQMIAREHLVKGEKDLAYLALGRRKYQQTLLSKTHRQLENLEQLVSTIEFSLIEVSVLHGLEQGNKVLKELNEELNVEAVEKLLQETHEARRYQAEIGEMLANALSRDDMDSVNAELIKMEAELKIPQVEEDQAPPKMEPLAFPEVPPDAAPTKDPTPQVPQDELGQTCPDQERVPLVS